MFTALVVLVGSILIKLLVPLELRTYQQDCDYVSGTASQLQNRETAMNELRAKLFT